MSIRLVNVAEEVYRFTSSNWRMLLAFAARYGRTPRPGLDPRNWDESLTWNEKWEVVGGASLTEQESQALAGALDQAIQVDPIGASVASELTRHAPEMRQRLPDYEPERHAADLLRDWTRFRDFARRGAFRVDLTD